MSKKRIKRPFTLSKLSNKKNLPLIVLSFFTGILIICLIIGGIIISYIWEAQKAESNGKITTLILQAVEGLNEPAPIDAQTGKAYIPQARLVLPMKQNTMGAELEYRYSSAQADFPEEIGIVNTFGFRSARSAMIGARNIEDTFKEVPKLQACTRGYQLAFMPIEDNPNPLKFKKLLSDGRKLYIYIDTDCQETIEDFDNYLNQIDSY